MFHETPSQELCYFLYARKSTDVEDKQVLSIDAQIVELKEFAKKLELKIADIFIEKQTAKKPGRPIFNKMLSRIQNDEANGVIAWLPDRLSRNSIDSGQVIYMLDENVLCDLKFPHFWFQNTPQGKYMLANEFNASKQYVDNLSVNTKRGLRQKVRDGVYPSVAPFGYKNDIRTKTILQDRKNAEIVKQCFNLYANGDKTCGEIADFLFACGVATKGRRKTKNDPKSAGGKKWHESRVKYMFSNPFYYGHFTYAGEIHEGKHKPIIEKALFDRVQIVLAGRGKIQKQRTYPPPLCRLVRCGFCGCFISGAVKTKHQKNGNHHEYIYYRCTHKNKAISCREPELREFALADQLMTIVNEFVLPKNWGDFMFSRLEEDELASKTESDILVANLHEKLDDINAKLKRLFDVYLDGDIEQNDYREKRADLMSDKKSFENKIEQVLIKADFWIEPMRNWIKNAISLCEINKNPGHFEIANAIRQIDGLNLKMTNKTVIACGDVNFNSPLKNPWHALRAAKKKAALSGDNFLISHFLVDFYSEIRTYFSTK